MPETSSSENKFGGLIIAYIKNYNVYMRTNDDNRIYRVAYDMVIYDEEDAERAVFEMKDEVARGNHPIVAIFVPEQRGGRSKLISKEEQLWFRPDPMEVSIDQQGMVHLVKDKNQDG